MNTTTRSLVIASSMARTLILASSLLLLAASAYAAKVIPGNYDHNSRYEVIETTAVATKDKAYSIGFETLQDLQKSSGAQLADKLGVSGFMSAKERSSVNLESGYVTVQELMNEQGNIVYRGRVNVNYHFSSESDRNR